MLVRTKQAVLVFSDDRTQQFQAPRDFIGLAPDWVATCKQGRRLQQAGVLQVQNTQNKSRRNRKEGR